jgi:hypothetical protein
MAAGGDILSAQNGVRLGDGWYAIEHFKGQTFRWIDGSDAQFFVSADRNVNARLRILVAAGPSAGGAPVPVLVRDATGKTVFAAATSGVQALTFGTPLRAGENVFTIHVAHTKDLRVPGDRRALNLRVFSIAALR